MILGVCGVVALEGSGGGLRGGGWEVGVDIPTVDGCIPTKGEAPGALGGREGDTEASLFLEACLEDGFVGFFSMSTYARLVVSMLVRPEGRTLQGENDRGLVEQFQCSS